MSIIKYLTIFSPFSLFETSNSCVKNNGRHIHIFGFSVTTTLALSIPWDSSGFFLLVINKAGNILVSPHFSHSLVFFSFCRQRKEKEERLTFLKWLRNNFVTFFPCMCHNKCVKSDCSQNAAKWISDLNKKWNKVDENDKTLLFPIGVWKIVRLLSLHRKIVEFSFYYRTKIVINCSKVSFPIGYNTKKVDTDVSIIFRLLTEKLLSLSLYPFFQSTL